MISAITPVMNTNTYSVQNHKNNNRNQNFGSIKTKFINFSTRTADEISEAFLCHFEHIAQKKGLNTEKLNNRGYSLILNGEDLNGCDDLCVALVDQKGKVIQNSCYPAKGSEKISAETFVDNIKRLKIFA